MGGKPPAELVDGYLVPRMLQRAEHEVFHRGLADRASKPDPDFFAFRPHDFAFNRHAFEQGNRHGFADLRIDAGSGDLAAFA